MRIKSGKKRIRLKILLLQSLQFFSMLVVSVSAVIILKHQTASFNGTIEQNNMVMSRLVELKTLFTGYHNEQTRYLLYSGDVDEDVKRKYSDAIVKKGEKIAEILSSFDEKSGDSTFLFIYNIRAYLRLSGEFTGSADANDPDKVRYHITVPLIQKYETANSAIDSLISASFGEYNAMTVRNREVFENSARLTVVFNIAVILIMSFASLYVAFSISRPVDVLKAELKKLAETGGDLSREISVNSNDEILEMASELNRFLCTLREIIREVKELSLFVKTENGRFVASLQNIVKGRDCGLDDIEIDEGVIQLQQYGDGVLGSITDQTTAIEEIVATLEEISASAGMMSKNAADTLGVSEQVLQEVREGVAEMEGLVSSVRSIDDSILSANDRINELVGLSGRVSDILVSISDISAQTNLLALNASIEAARAGKAGRGFAVVADEVLKLAEQTGSESERISELVSEINGKIISVKNANEDVIRSIKNSAGLSESVSGKLDRVFRVTGMNHSQLNSMIISISEQELAVEEITSAITDVSENAEKIRNRELNNSEILERIKLLLADKLRQIAFVSEKTNDLHQKVEKFVT